MEEIYSPYTRKDTKESDYVYGVYSRYKKESNEGNTYTSYNTKKKNGTVETANNCSPDKAEYTVEEDTKVNYEILEFLEWLKHICNDKTISHNYPQNVIKFGKLCSKDETFPREGNFDDIINHLRSAQASDKIISVFETSWSFYEDDFGITTEKKYPTTISKNMKDTNKDQVRNIEYKIRKTVPRAAPKPTVKGGLLICHPGGWTPSAAWKSGKQVSPSESKPRQRKSSIENWEYAKNPKGNPSFSDNGHDALLFWLKNKMGEATIDYSKSIREILKDGLMLCRVMRLINPRFPISTKKQNFRKEINARVAGKIQQALNSISCYFGEIEPYQEPHTREEKPGMGALKNPCLFSVQDIMFGGPQAELKIVSCLHSLRLRFHRHGSLYPV